MRRLHSTDDCLILFCAKACDQDARGCGVLRLKNAVLKERSPASAVNADAINIAFKGFKQHRNANLERLNALRNTLVAHSDAAMIIGDDNIGMTTGEVIDFSEQIIDLVRVLAMHSGLREVGTLAKPIESDNSLSIERGEWAENDADAFWKAQFSVWAK